MRICGLDEAGRGCIIGPLVMCGVLMEEAEIKKLGPLGVKDSKLLTPEKRTKLSQLLSSQLQHHLVIISPEKIDEAVNSEETNLNWLEADHSVEIIEALKPDTTILDCPSRNIKAYSAYITKKLSIKRPVQAEHKADLNHLIVGAASILAKVRRDAEIQKIKEEIKEDFGSGYLGDPKTKKFLEAKWDIYPHIFRNSWAPYKKLIENSIE